MPGFSELPNDDVDGAPEARRADELWRNGDRDAAIKLLESLLDAVTVDGSEHPTWLVLRLAMCYRVQERYADELHVLSRGQASQTSDSERAR